MRVFVLLSYAPDYHLMRDTTAISRIPCEELDARVALALGWQRAEGPLGSDHWYDEDGRPVHLCNWSWYHAYQGVPGADTWTLWARLPFPKRLSQEGGNYYDESNYDADPPFPGPFTTAVYCGGRSYGSMTDLEPEIAGYGDNPAEAICRAFIAYREAQAARPA
jgi:hypothetical protein